MKACLYIGRQGNEWIEELFPGKSPGEMTIAGKSWCRHAVELFARNYRREYIGNIHNFFVGLLLSACAMAVIIPIVAAVYWIVQYIADRFCRP